jgi:hypothetical protein
MTDKLNTRDHLIDIGKEAMEAQAAIGDEFMPTLIVEHVTAEHPDGQYDVMVLVGGHPFDMITAIAPALREAHPVSLGLTVDSYMMTAEGNPDEALARRASYGGSLQAMHEAGEPGVSECLVIYILTPTTSEGIQLPYVRHANTIRWSPEYVLPGDAQFTGRLVEALRSVWS